MKRYGPDSPLPATFPRPYVRAVPETFSPGGAIGFTTFVLTATPPLEGSLAAWQFAILGGSGVVTRSGGTGAPPPTLTWDGEGQPEGGYTERK